MTVLNPAYESLRVWVESVPRIFAEQGEVIYDARNQIRLITAPDGKELCVKRFHAPRGLNGWIYKFWRTPKAVRAYENAVRLCEAGIATPEPVAYILEEEGGRLRESYLISLFTAHMHEEGILHRDYSPGNILFDVDEKGQVHFEIVDINRMVFDKPVGLERACRNFCRLWGKEDFFRLLAKEYAKARGFDEAECTRLTIKYWKRFWRFRK